MAAPPAARPLDRHTAPACGNTPRSRPRRADSFLDQALATQWMGTRMKASLDLAVVLARAQRRTSARRTARRLRQRRRARRVSVAIGSSREPASAATATTASRASASSSRAGAPAAGLRDRGGARARARFRSPRTARRHRQRHHAHLAREPRVGARRREGRPFRDRLRELLDRGRRPPPHTDLPSTPPPPPPPPLEIDAGSSPLRRCRDPAPRRAAASYPPRVRGCSAVHVLPRSGTSSSRPPTAPPVVAAAARPAATTSAAARRAPSRRRRPPPTAAATLRLPFVDHAGCARAAMGAHPTDDRQGSVPPRRGLCEARSAACARACARARSHRP